MVCSACLPPVAGSEAAVEQVGRYTRRQSGVVREIQVNGTRRRTEPASLAVWCGGSCGWRRLDRWNTDT